MQDVFTTDNLIFLIGLTLIVIHEMDAVRCKEWRIFPGLSKLNDKAGYLVFLFAHIPIFCWIFWKLSNGSNIDSLKIGFDIFLFVHLGLHLLFLKHRDNKFKDWISWIIIIGSGFCGLLDLIIK